MRRAVDEHHAADARRAAEQLRQLEPPAVAGGTRDDSAGCGDGGWNAGNNAHLPAPIAPDRSRPSPGATQAYQSGLSAAGKLRRVLSDDPQSQRQVDELMRAMQTLDPKRFPGNPAMARSYTLACSALWTNWSCSCA